MFKKRFLATIMALSLILSFAVGCSGDKKVE